MNEPTDKELAGKIREACAELSTLTHEAQERGLKVEIDVIETPRIDREYSAYVFTPKIERPGEKL